MRKALYWSATTHRLRPKAKWFPLDIMPLHTLVYLGIILVLAKTDSIRHGWTGFFLLFAILLSGMIAGFLVCWCVRRLCAPRSDTSGDARAG